MSSSPSPGYQKRTPGPASGHKFFAGLRSHPALRFFRTMQGTLLLLLLAVLIPLLIAMVIVYSRTAERRRTEELQNNLELARAVAAAFNAYISDIRHQEMAIGLALTSPQPPSPEQANKLLSAAAGEFPAICHYSWVSPEGRILASSEQRIIGWSITDRPFFAQIAGGKDWIVSNQFKGQLSEKPAFAVALGIRDKSGALQGIVVAAVQPEQLDRVLPVARARDGVIAIIDRQGKPVYRYPPHQAGDKTGQAYPPEALAAALAGHEATGAFISSCDGLERLAGYVPIPSIGWVAEANRPLVEAMAPVQRQAHNDLWGLAICLTGVLLAIQITGRQLATPIRRLQEHALAIVRGNLDHRVAVSGPVELQELAVAFNRMTEEVRLRAEERRRAEAEREQLLAEVQHRAVELDVTISSIADGLIVYNPTGQIVRMNAAAIEILGYADDNPHSLAERMAHLQIETATGEPFPIEELPAPRALRGEMVRNCVNVIHPAADKTIWLSSSAAPIRTANGQLMGAISTFVDITALHRLQEQREDLLRAVSHDLRNPLAIVHGQAELLLRNLAKADLAGREQRCARAILTGARRMNAMIQDLVDSARFESGQLKLICRTVELRSFIMDLKERMAGMIESERIRVEAEEGLPFVLADPDRLERILLNLLSNALKYSAPPAEVTVTLTRHTDELITAVADRGPGIAPEDLAHLFTRYYRAQPAREHREGLGLGLYISRMLVEAHGGRLWVESEPGQGSTFYFTLPLAWGDNV